MVFIFLPKDTPRQQITINKQLPQRKTQTNNTPPNNRSSYNRTHRLKVQSQAICRNYTRGFNCFHGRNCPDRYPPFAQAHLTTTEETPTSDATTPAIDLDFPYGPEEKWWLTHWSDILAITYLTSSNILHNNLCSSEPLSPSKEPPSPTPQC